RPRLSVEMQYVVLQRLPGPVGEHIPIRTADRIGQPAASRFQVALQTNFKLPRRIEPRRVDDRARLRAARVLPSGPMAALAIDRLSFTSRPPRITCVTEQALVVDAPAEIHVVRPVVPRIHRPISALLAIPAGG